jgi:alkanesulfonate monooxygenase SsuD/methylene tetrahydromethanopterin reductase-like flavin-dependent oxidoreductase (luciferase family)
MNLPPDASEAEIKANYIRQRDRWTLGHGTFGPITGTPDQVTDTICKMKDVGYSGLAFSFVNYLNELPYFQQEVMPRLEARGLRRAVG